MKKKHFYAAVILFSLLVCGIKPTLAIHNIPFPTDPTIGEWDSDNRIYTLTKDVTEGLVITENNLTLDGAGYTVSGVASGPGVDLSGRTDVTIQNLNVTGCGHGIYLSLSNDCTVTDNTVSTCVYGIYLSLSNDCTVTYNTASTCDYGIWLTNSSGNILTGNTAWYNNDHGIGLSPLSDGNTLTENTASYNDRYGIYLNHSSSNVLSRNTAESNNSCGIYLKESSNYNTIYNNNFIGNTTQAKVSTELHAPCTDNVFNLPAPTGGNYWSDWSGLGAYTFTGGQDNLPWTVPNGWLNLPPTNQPPVADAGPDQIVEQDSDAGASVTLDGSGSSDDGQIQPLTYTWTWAGGGSSTGVNPTPTVTLPLGTTTVTLTAYDGELSDTDTVDITVESAESPEAEAIEPIIVVLEGMGVPEDAEKKMDKAVKELNKAIDEFNKDRIDKAFDKIAKAVKHLMKAQKKGAGTQSVIDDLVALVQGITEEAIEDAIETVGADNLHVVKAQEHYDKAFEKLADGKYDAAIKEFKKAYKEAMKALGE